MDTVEAHEAILLAVESGNARPPQRRPGPLPATATSDRAGRAHDRRRTDPLRFARRCRHRGVRSGLPPIRIPALALTPAGTCLAVFDARCDLDDLPAPVDLVARRSTDGGRSFGPRTVVRAGTGVIGHGDASLVVDHEDAGPSSPSTPPPQGSASSSRLSRSRTTTSGCCTATCRSPTMTGSPGSIGGSATTFASASTPASPRSAWERRPGCSGLFAASGSGTQIRAGRFHGRLLQGFVALIGTQVYAAVAHSDDHGRTWVMGRPVGARRERERRRLAGWRPRRPAEPGTWPTPHGLVRRRR